MWDVIAESVHRHTGLEGQRESLLNHLVTTSHRSAEPITEDELIAECSDHFIAGADFLSSMLAFSLAHLGQQPEFTRRLRSEVLSTDPGDLDGAPFLSAFVKEALRIYASAPGPLLRIIPQKTQDFTLSGHSIPPGVAVGVQAVSSHFDHQVFNDPETFAPDRWLDATARENGNFMAFGLGSRDCVGKHLATMALKMAIAAVVVEFDVAGTGQNLASLLPNQPPAFPKRPPLMNLRFVPVE